MHYAALFLYIFFPLEILLLGIFVLIISGMLSSKITQKYPYFLSRMRIIYGYIAITCSVISLIMFWYIYSPFEEIWNPYFNIQITPFTAGIYYTIGIATVIASFISIVEVSLESKKSYLLFISLLLIQSSTWFVIASNSWINILFGFILIFMGLNLFLRSLNHRTTPENRKVFTSYLAMTSMSLSLMFIGIACHSFSGNLFSFSIGNTSMHLWEYLSIIFVIFSLLILIGVPPFHSWFFDVENKQFNASTFVLLIIQRGLALAFLVKYSSMISVSQLSTVLLWFYTILGLLYSLWGVLGAITQSSLQKLLYYLSLLYIGIIFLILSDIFSISIPNENLIESLKTVNYGVFAYVLIFSFSISLFSSISKGFKTDDIDLLSSISRNSISQYVVNIFNFLLLFIIPISMFIISKKYSFASFYTPRMYLSSIFFLVVLLFSLIYFIRIMKLLFVVESKEKLDVQRIEPGTIISTLLLCVIIISVLILFVQFLEYCSLISLNLLS